MIDEAPESGEDPRVTKAAEIFEFLQRHPREIAKDPEDIAAQFGADPQLVDRLLRTHVIAERKKRIPRVTLKQIFCEIWRVVSRAVLGATAQPYVFLFVVSLLFVISGAVSVVSMKFEGNTTPNPFDSFPVTLGAILVVAAEILCLFVRPRFRYLFAAMLFSGAALAIIVATLPSRHMSISRPFFLGLVFASGALIVGAFGLIAVFVGYGIQVGAARNKEAHLTRQQLITKLFDLQAQLAQVQTRIGKAHKFRLKKIRDRLIPISFVIGLVLVAAELAIQLQLEGSRISGQTRLHLLNESRLFDMVDGALWPIVICCLAYIAKNFRKTVAMFVALSLGGLAAGMGLLFLRHSGNADYITELSRQGREAIYHACLVLIMVYILFIRRELARLRIEGSPTEASIIADLIDVRYRLALASAKVYVMAVDVVGSTRMKDKADPLLAEFTFRSFQDWIAELANEHRGKVDVMTGDGAIVAFSDPAAALSCATAIQSEICHFNESKNRLKTPFKLRVALHSGHVVGELDKVQFTDVIDVAAHVEKLSPVGGFAATLDFLKDFDQPLEGVVAGPVMDGRQVYLCEPAALPSPIG